MRKETVTYTDADNILHTEDFYFNLNKAELQELNFEWGDGGMRYALEQIKKNDPKTTVDMMKKIIIASYGERVGNKFRKMDDDGHKLVYKNFLSTDAYSELFISMMSDTTGNHVAEFIRDILPKDVREAAQKEIDESGGDVKKMIEDTEKKVAAASEEKK